MEAVTRLQTEIQAIDRATLTPLVRRARRSDGVEIDDWTCRPIYGGAANMGVYRFAGNGRDHGQPIEWSIILKALGTIFADAEALVYSLERELLAYQSGLLEDLPGGLAAPRYLGSELRPGGNSWLWLEDIADAIGARWPLERYGIVARQLGRFNGVYLAGRPLPAQPWLSRSWLRSWVEQAAPVIPLLPSLPEHPLAKRMYPPDLVEAYLRLWAERERFLAAIECLPQTFCHLDVFRRNMFARRGADGQDQTVLIDWSFAGIGAIGEELACLIVASVELFEVEVARAAELDRIVFDGYLVGLRDAGWHGDPRQVRFGYAASAVLRYGVGVLGLLVKGLLDEQAHPLIEQIMGRSIDECVDIWAAQIPFLKGLIAEAWELLEIM